MQLIAHYVATKWTLLYYWLHTIVPQLCHYVTTRMPLVVTYICATWGHNIGIVLQLDGHYNSIIWPLIKYYLFIIHIKCEFVDLKFNPNVT